MTERDDGPTAPDGALPVGESARPDSPWRHRPGLADQSLRAVPEEARNFQGHRAGIVTKVAANCIDLAVVIALVAGGYVVAVGLRFVISPTGFSPPKVSFAVLILIGLGLMVLYFWLSWATTGRTYGDHLLGLRVVGLRGTRMRPVPALVRALFCVGFMPGLFWTVISRQNRSIQDTVLRSSVIYDWEVRQSRLRHGQVDAEVAEPPR